MKYLFTTILLVFNIQIFSQDENTFWDFYSNNRLSTINAGKGCTGIASENDISGIVINPANLNIKKKFQVHAEYVYKSDVPWGRGLFVNYNLKEFHPSFMAAGGYNINDYLQTGLLWYTTNSKKLDLGELTITNEFGHEISTTDAIENMSINSLLLPVVYNYKDKIKAGVNFTLLYYHGYTNYMRTEKNPDGFQEAFINAFNFNVKVGFVVIPFKGLSIGGTFTPYVSKQFKWTTSDGEDLPNYSDIFPMKIGIGAEYRFSKFPLKIDFDYNYTNSSKQSGLKDRNDVNIGIEYDLFKQLTLRTGFFTIKDYRQNTNNGHYFDPLGKYDEYFLTIGGTYKIKKYSFSLALLDSHISTGLIKQTLINGGITMDF